MKLKKAGGFYFPALRIEFYDPVEVMLPDNVVLSGDYSWGYYAWYDGNLEAEGVYFYSRNNPNGGVQQVAAVKARDVHFATQDDSTPALLYFTAESPTTLYVAEAPTFEPVAVTNGELRGRHWDTAVFWSPVPQE